jgi:hypothetical protein
MALDIGGCTTDFYVNVIDNPLYVYTGSDPKKKVKRAIMKTPNTPKAFRRVEGKYGLAYNAENIMELERFQDGSMSRDLDQWLNRRFPGYEPGDDAFSSFVTGAKGARHLMLQDFLMWIHNNPHQMPTTEVWTSVYSWLAREILRAATANNAGYVKETDTYFLQYGVNLYTDYCTTLLIGGTIYHKCRENTASHANDLKLIAGGALYDPEEPGILRPNGQVLLDANYLVSTVGGLYGRLDPERALRVMKRNLKVLDMKGNP